MPVEDVFTISGRGTVATGRLERGVVKVGDAAEIVGLQDEAKQTTITGVEMFRKSMDQAEAGDNIGCLLRVLTVRKLSADRLLPSRAQQLLTQSSQAKFTFLLRKRVAVISHS